VGLRSFFKLLARKCVRCIALTKLGMLMNSLKTTHPFITIDNWHWLISHIKPPWCASTPSSPNINFWTSVNCYLKSSTKTSTLFLAKVQFVWRISPNVTQFMSKCNFNFETEGVMGKLKRRVSSIGDYTIWGRYLCAPMRMLDLKGLRCIKRECMS
jgi:hypothetical protein